MKKVIAMILLLMAAGLALALPKPSQIEDALAAKHYDEARSMVAEVLRERPDSARAHLLNAYLLAHVDHNKAAANAELQSASGLDKRGDVRSSPLFGRVVAEIDLMPSSRAVTVAKPVPAYRSGADAAWYVISWALVIALIVALIVAVIRAFRDTPARTVLIGSGGSGTYGGYAAPRQSAPSEQHFASTIVQSTPGMGAFGMAASVAGGVVAGNAISDMLGHSRYHRSDYDDEDERRRRRDAELQNYSTDYGSPVSTDSERSSFSSSSSGSDSWSSGSSWSSSDSGSSSDSWSSSDSGSSSSGDW